MLAVLLFATPVDFVRCNARFELFYLFPLFFYFSFFLSFPVWKDLKIHGEDRPVKLMTKARISAIPNVFETELATKMDVRSVDTRPVLTQCEDQIQRLQRLKLAIASDQGAHRHAITHALERMKQQLEVLMILNENSNNAVVGEPAVFQQGKRREC